MATITDILGSDTITEGKDKINTNFSNVNTELGTHDVDITTNTSNIATNTSDISTLQSDKLDASSYTAADVLSKLETVDGSGSGLDADLLDGHDSTYFLDVGSYTASDVLSKLLTVDGSGSNLDADLLDGQQGTYYLDYANFSNTPSLAAVATSGAYSDLSGTPTIPTALSQLTFDVGSVSTTEFGYLSGVTSAIQTQLSSKEDSSALAAVAESGNYSDLSGTPTLATVASSGSYSDLSGTPTLSTVATTGSYTDLSGTPTAADLLTSIKTVDGSGSGLDADTLDAHDSSYFVDTATAQTIDGAKTFGSAITSPSGVSVYAAGSAGYGITESGITPVDSSGGEGLGQTLFYSTADTAWAIGTTASHSLLFSENNLPTWSNVTSKPSSFTPSTHASTHATGGSDAIAPSDIGAVDLANAQTISGSKTFSALTQYSSSVPFEFDTWGGTGSDSMWFHGSGGSGDNMVKFVRNGSSDYDLYANGTDKVWTDANAELQNLIDVDTTSLANGTVPTWDSSTSKFTMQTPSGGSGIDFSSPASISTYSLTHGATWYPAAGLYTIAPNGGSVEIHVIVSGTDYYAGSWEGGTIATDGSSVYIKNPSSFSTYTMAYVKYT